MYDHDKIMRLAALSRAAEDADIALDALRKLRERDTLPYLRAFLDCSIRDASVRADDARAKFIGYVDAIT